VLQLVFVFLFLLVEFVRYGEFTILNQLDPEYNLCLNDAHLTEECGFIALNR
jgi:hypothetical protein